MKRMKHLICLCLTGILISIIGCTENPRAGKPESSDLMNIDYRALVSKADLYYDKPVRVGQAGMPLGNGRMGSMIWTTPLSLRMQINRVDVFGINCETNSFPARNSDYANGCGYVDVNFGDFIEEVFTSSSFSQHLSVYDGLITTKGKGVITRSLAWNDRDVMAIEINDQRKQPVPLNIDLRMLRYQNQFYYYSENFILARQHAIKFQTIDHFATSSLNVRDGRIILKQVFREGNHYNASAIAISVIGRDSKARYYNELSVRLTPAPGKGSFTILIGSASSFDPKEDVEARALNELYAAEEKGFEGLLNNNKAWWHDYWSKAFVHLHSDDGKADLVEQHYTYFLYLMGSSSRGDYPPRFINSIWNTLGDNMHWGSEFWWWNQSAWHNPLPPMNRGLLNPLLNMYSRHLDAYATAAQQQWGSKGIYFPETVFFDGLEKLPDDIAAEMRDLYLVRKPWEKRSQKFMNYASTKLGHNSRWNWLATGRYEKGHWIISDKGTGPFGHVTHSTSPTGKIAYLFWLNFEYTQDTAWLRKYAYPVIRGSVEFYRNFPNLKKDSKGKYHIYHVSYDEEIYDVQNSIEEMAAMHGMIPVLIRASEILNTDADMRPLWKEFLDNLAPLPDSRVLPGPNDSTYWISGIPPARLGRPEHENLEPAIFFDLLTKGTEDKEMIRIGNNTYNRFFPNGTADYHPGQDDRKPVAAAHLGRAGDIKNMLPAQLNHDPVDRYFTGSADTIGPGIMPNRITMQAQAATDFERIGNNAHALHTALLQSVPPQPGKEAVIYLFPAWPREWDAAFSLAARGAFLVSSLMKKGEIEFVDILSQVGGECRICNPWPGRTVKLFRNNTTVNDLAGSLLVFPTSLNEKLRLIPQDADLPKEVIPFPGSR